MIITSQGFGHFTEGLNNQDFGMESNRCVLILDGCSGAKYSEVGTRLFAQLLSRKEDWDNVEKFENNVKTVFEDIIKMMRKYYPSQEDLEKEFIMENLLFTILACFQTEDAFIVKFFGDGYIITENKKGLTSYLRYSYGKYPPYFAYKYCDLVDTQLKDFQFKTFTFNKADFPKVAIATDGVMPIAKGEVRGIDRLITGENEIQVLMASRSQRQSFADDVTIGTLGGK